MLPVTFQKFTKIFENSVAAGSYASAARRKLKNIEGGIAYPSKDASPITLEVDLLTASSSNSGVLLQA